MKKQLVPLLLSIFIFLISASGVLAARSISIATDRNSISLDEEMIITASVSGFTEGEKIYIKGAFYKDGGSNYFGFTKLNDSWVKNSATAKSQKEVTIGDWDESVLAKLDYEDSGYVGIGEYKFKLGFYYLTSSGNTSSVNWSANSLGVSIINEPSPTPEPVNTNSKSDSENSITDMPTPIPSKVVATITGNKTSKSVKITNAKKEASQYAQIKPIEEVEEEENDTQVLGAEDSISSSIYIFSGGFILVAAFIILIKRELKGRKIR